MDPAHRQERMDEPSATYLVISCCLRWAFLVAEERLLVEPRVAELSSRRSGVRVEAIPDEESEAL